MSILHLQISESKQGWSQKFQKVGCLS